MEVTLLGTGDTTGTPTVGCSCATCAAARERGVERSRFSVHVHDERSDTSLLIDASPDFRHQFLTRDRPLPDAAVISHVHFDHLDGLGNVYRLVDELPVYAADEVDPVTEQTVAGTVRERYDYLDRVSVHQQSPMETFTAAGFEVTLVPVEHPPLLCYGLRVEAPEAGGSLAITGDTTFAIPAESKAVLRDADLALVEGIVDAAHCEAHPAGGDHENADGVPRTFGTKHMTLTGAREMAAELAADEYRIVHCSHFPDPDEAFADDVAVDGERFSLPFER